MIPEDVYEYFTTTVGLITAHYKGKNNVMAAEWTFNISYEPFLIAVFVNPKHYTYELIRDSKEFGINLCSEEQGHLANYAGTRSGRDVDKFKSGLFETYKAKKIKAPLIKGCILNAECKLIQEIPTGDHVIMVGEVLECTYDKAKKPLIRHLQHFWKLSERAPHKEIQE